MKDVLILSQNIQGLIAAGLLAASGDDVSVIEFQNEELEILKEKICNELGFELVDHTLELYGRKIKK